MTARSSQPDPLTPRPLSNRSIAAGALVVLTVTAVVRFLLLRRYGGQGAQVQLDAIRTAGTLVIGTGGAVALLLTARRQRYTELALVHTDRDATERRITELYTKAADQLGSEKAPVRLAGLYALERLARNTLDQRQTIVNVICAYLRMPYTPPEEQPPTEDDSAEAHTRHENRVQEGQVRLTAQDILSRNLQMLRAYPVIQRRWYDTRPPDALPPDTLPIIWVSSNWSDIHVNLSGALLHDFSLEECHLHYAQLAGAEFTGTCSFQNAKFDSEATFSDAQFDSPVGFGGAKFDSEATFWDAQFADGGLFGIAQFKDRANFSNAQFGPTFGGDFGGVQFSGEASFREAQFHGYATFSGAQFAIGATFSGAQFAVGATFKDAQFASEADFEGARVASVAEPHSVWPPGWTTRPANPDEEEDPAFLYLTKIEDVNQPDT